eukprot:TRINITY_DN756_c3_g1_i1.p1 TRINITY_DN756_c3_g1~~TRINITY_DN756_c3_g1_i1.p1  ORF type:complete len:157 (+),score=53.31 TRINITY_DN756_c3_g1_i1:1028-1498(+)
MPQTNQSQEHNTYPEQASKLKLGHHIVLQKKHPCVIKATKKSKPGKHGATKTRFFGVDIITGKRYEGFFPTTSMVTVPIVDRLELPLLNIEDEDYLTLLNDDNSVLNNVPLDGASDEVIDQINEYFDHGEECIIKVVRSMGMVKVIGVKKDRSFLQ